MVYKDINAEIVEVVPFVFIIDEKVIAEIVEVLPFVFRIDEKVIAKIVEVLPFVIMVDEDINAEIVEVLLFVIMVYKDVNAEIVEVVPFVFIIDEKVIAEIVEVLPFVIMVDEKVIAKNLKNAHITYVHVIVWSVHQSILLQLKKTRHLNNHMAVIQVLSNLMNSGKVLVSLYQKFFKLLDLDITLMLLSITFTIHSNCVLI